MQARHSSVSDKAFFDYLEGEAREGIKYRPEIEQNDPDKIISVLRELYGCSQLHVLLQDAFFSRKQQEGGVIIGVLPCLDMPPGARFPSLSASFACFVINWGCAAWPISVVEKLIPTEPRRGWASDWLGSFKDVPFSVVMPTSCHTDRRISSTVCGRH